MKIFVLSIAILAFGAFWFYQKDIHEKSNPQVFEDSELAQLLMIGFRGDSLETNRALVNILQSTGIGGVILFDYDVPGKKYERNIFSYEQLKHLITSIHTNSKAPIFVAIDQEGGKVSRLKSARGFIESPSAEYIGLTNNADSTRFWAWEQAQQLKNLGFNVVFAPVVDVNVNPKNPVIGGIGRSYSATPKEVIFHAGIVVESYQSAGILPVLKHFPGHGSSHQDSHLGVVDVTAYWSATELYPFEKLLQRNPAPAVMTAHIFNKNWDEEFPATLSEKVIRGLLRNKIGYEGLVFSDDMQMGAIHQQYGLEQAIEKSLNAGVDMLVFANNSVYDPDISTRAIAVIQSLLKQGKVSGERIESALGRIRAAKDALARK